MKVKKNEDEQSIIKRIYAQTCLKQKLKDELCDFIDVKSNARDGTWNVNINKTYQEKQS